MTEELRVRKYFLSLITILVLAASPLTLAEPSVDTASREQLSAIQSYIKQSWHTLTRSSAQLAKAAPDPKFKAMTDGRWPVYVSRRESIKGEYQADRTEATCSDVGSRFCHDRYSATAQ